MSDVLIEKREGALWVTFNRPFARNAFTFNMYDELKAACERAPDDADVKAVVLTGAGEKAFAAGTDIAQFRAFEGPEDAIAYEVRADAVLGAVEACPLPTVAAISGACTGGGAAIAAVCDLRLATPSLKYGFPIARTLGNCLSIANLRRLSSLLGHAKIKEMIFLAKLIEAEEAARIGLVHEVLPDHAALMARTEEVVATLGKMAPLTLKATKEALRRLSLGRNDDQDLVTACYTSEDFKQGLEAFLAKRPYGWQGR